jgi:hypothetical protein
MHIPYFRDHHMKITQEGSSPDQHLTRSKLSYSADPALNCFQTMWFGAS